MVSQLLVPSATTAGPRRLVAVNLVTVPIQEDFVNDNCFLLIISVKSGVILCCVIFGTV